MRKLFLILCLIWVLFFCSSKNALAQNNYLDSLKMELKRNISDSSRIAICEEIGYNIAESDPKAAREYFFHAYQLSAKNNIQPAMGATLAYIGMSYYKSDLYDSALFYIDSAMTFFQNDTLVKSQANMGALLNEKANIEKAQGKYQSAISHYLKSNDITRQFDTKEKWINLSNGYLNIAKVFEENKHYKKALEYNLKVFESVKEGRKTLKDPAYLNILELSNANAELTIANIYIKLEQLSKVLQRLNTIEPVIASIHSDDLNANLYATWGSYYKAIDQPENAINAYNTSLKYAKNSSLRKELALRELGYIYRDLHEYQQSAAYFEKALAIQRTRKKKQVEAELLKQLANINAFLQQNKKAIGYYQQYIQLSDSLNDYETKVKISELETTYQTQKKQDSILVLQKDNQLQQLQLRKRKTLNVGLIAGCVLMLTVIILIYRNFKHRQHLLKQEKIIHTQRINELEKERQLIAVQSVMKGQEDERSRLARDLHDGVGGLLSGVKLSLSTMKGNVFLSEKNVQVVGQVIEQLDQSISELRRVSHNMMPESLIKFGLRETLENYCENINLSQQLHVRLQAYGMETRLEQSAEIVIYRIIQELLNNIIKHADAKNILIQLIKGDKRFDLTVEDDGKGFDMDAALKKGGAGLTNILARAEYLGGKLDIQSKPGEGTSVHFEILI